MPAHQKLLKGKLFYQIAKNCRSSVEMIELFYASHIKTRLTPQPSMSRGLKLFGPTEKLRLAGLKPKLTQRRSRAELLSDLTT